MQVTQTEARKIIEQYYPNMPFRLTMQCTIGVRPIIDQRPTLAWRKEGVGKDALVWIGELHHGGIDWDWSTNEHK